MNDDFTLLHDYPLFRDLDEEQMQAVMEVCREECFLPGTVLFEEGERAGEIFVLTEGQVEVSFTAGEGVLALLHPLEPGEIIE